MTTYELTVRVTVPHGVGLSRAKDMLTRVIVEGRKVAEETQTLMRREEWDDKNIRAVCKSSFDVE